MPIVWSRFAPRPEEHLGSFDGSTPLSAADLELIRNARRSCEEDLNASSAESTLSDVLENLGGSAPLAIKRAHEELENGDREAAANHLDRILK